MKERKSLHREGKQNVSFSVANYWVAKKVFTFFEISQNSRESSRSFHTKGLYKGGTNMFLTPRKLWLWT
jgi:hypothetical protein